MFVCERGGTNLLSGNIIDMCESNYWILLDRGSRVFEINRKYALLIPNDAQLIDGQTGIPYIYPICIQLIPSAV